MKSILTIFLLINFIIAGTATAKDKLWDEYDMMLMAGEVDIFRLEQIFNEASDLRLKSSALAMIISE